MEKPDSPPPGPLESWVGKHARLTTVLLFLLALLLRLVHTWHFSHSPYYDHPIIDALAYDLRGWSIAQGDWLGDRIFYQDPWYPYQLALIYKIFGHSYTAVFLVQSLMGALLCILVMSLAGKVFRDHPRVNTLAALAGLLTAVCTPLIYYDNLILKTSAEVFWTVLHLWTMVVLVDHTRDRGRLLPFAALGTGMMLGLNLLNRGNYALLAPMFAFWLFWALSRGRPELTRHALASVALYTVGAVLVVAPVTVRNRVVGGEWVLVTSQGGQNFYIGNNEHNTTGSYGVTDEIRANPKFEEIDFLAMARRDTGRELSPTEASKHFFRKGLDWIVEHPGDWLSLYLKKWSLWFLGIDVPDNYSFDFIARHYAPLLKIPFANPHAYNWLGWCGLAISLAGAGVAGGLSLRNPGRLLLALFTAGYSLSMTAFFVYDRYRLPIVPVLLLFMAGFLIWLATEWRKIPLQWKALSLLPVLLFGFLSFRARLQPSAVHWITRDDSIQLFNLGTIFLDNNEPERALEFFDQAVAANPDNDMAANEIALVYWQTYGKIAEARDIFQRLVEKNPDNMGAWHNLGYTLAMERRYAEAERAFKKAGALRPDLPSVDMNLGALYFAQGRVQQAREAYRNYVAKQNPKFPDSEGGYADAATVLLDSPDSVDFATGLEALFRIPQPDPANPAWVAKLASARLPLKLELILRDRLAEWLEAHPLGSEARSAIMARLNRPLPEE